MLKSKTVAKVKLITVVLLALGIVALNSTGCMMRLDMGHWVTYTDTAAGTSYKKCEGEGHQCVKGASIEVAAVSIDVPDWATKYLNK